MLCETWAEPVRLEIEQFNFETALIVIDDRLDYGEVREIAIGFIGARLHVAVYNRRMPALRIISLRKANERERMNYGNATKKA